MRWAAGMLAVVALAGCPASMKQSDQAKAGPDAADATRPAPTERPGSRGDVEACVDQWLTQHKLNEYGDAEGTMYTGGTPLFDERTGETKDRLAYVYAKQPEAKAACQK